MICKSDIFRFVGGKFETFLLMSKKKKKTLLVCLTEYSNGVVDPKSNTMLTYICFKGQNLLFCKDAADDINARNDAISQELWPI